MLLMLCDQCAAARGLADLTDGVYTERDVVGGVRVGCFPDLYGALAGNPPIRSSPSSGSFVSDSGAGSARLQAVTTRAGLG
jgi:hypothetical protein